MVCWGHFSAALTRVSGLALSAQPLPPNRCYLLWVGRPLPWPPFAVVRLKYRGMARGRDGSPSRPFAKRVTDLCRLNGGLGEPALPKTPLRSVGRDGSPSRPFAKRVTDLCRLNGGLGEPALPKTSLRSVGISIGSTAGSESPPYPTKKDSTWCCPYPLKG